MKLWCFVGLLVAVWLDGIPPTTALINRRVGIQLLSYFSLDGRLPDGSCCDGMVMPNDSSACVPDKCDTSFVYCLRPRSNMSSYVAMLETAALIDNNTVTKFGRLIDPHVPGSTTALLVMSVTTMEDLVMEIEAVEVDPQYGTNRRTNLGTFRLPIAFNDIFNHLKWHTFHLNNSLIRLDVNITSFCNKHNYGASCDIYCKPHRDSSGQYTCDEQGNKICNQGYKGSSCKDIIDLCVVSVPPPVCHNGGTCQPVPNDYTCLCAPGFTGRLCDVRLTTTVKTTLSLTSTSTSTTAASTSSSTTAKPTTTKLPTLTSTSASTSSSTTAKPTTTKLPTTTSTSTSTSSSTTVKPTTTKLPTTTSTSKSTSTSTSSTTTSPSTTKLPTTSSASTSTSTSRSMPTTSSTTKMSLSKAAQKEQGNNRKGGQTIAFVLGPLAAFLSIAAAIVITYYLIKRGSRESVVEAAWEEPLVETNPSPPQPSDLPSAEAGPPSPVVVEW
ncbi:hypothetical protein ACOMHN_007194 [Nucella lapillus]